MKRNMSVRKIALLLVTVLIAAACMATGCRKESKYEPGTTAEGGELGEGKTTFLFEVTDGAGKLYAFTVHTDETLVGRALQNIGLVAGEEGPYGLYVKVVNGIVADYDADGTYWAFYIDGEYAMTGIDTTPIEAGKTYQMKVEK